MLSENIFFTEQKSAEKTVLGILPDNGGGVLHIPAKVRAPLPPPRQLLDALPHMAWLSDANGAVTFLNKHWYTYTGTPQTTLLSSRSLFKFLHPKDRMKMKQLWQKAKNNCTGFDIEYRWLRWEDKKYRWHAGHAEPVIGPDGQVLHWVGTCIDIQDKKAAELLLTKKEAEIKQINADLDSFVYMSSHDLKLPIVNIGALFNEIIETVKFSDSEGPKMVEMVKESLKQVQGTIRDLGDMVKVQKDINQCVDHISLEEAVNEVKETLAGQIKNLGATFNTNFGEVPQICFSSVNFKNILFNLFSNSLKFRHPNRNPEIKLRSWRQDNYVCLEIADNGIGIDVDRYGKKMFQMFRRFHNHESGSGLGLYIVNRAMEKCAGKVEVDSTPGQGTTFTLFFSETGYNGE